MRFMRTTIMTARNRPKLFLVIEPAITISSPSCANPGSNIGSEGVLALRAKIIPPCAKGTFPGITVPSGRITAVAAARKVKEEPKNTGTLNLVQQWNIKLPALAENNANDGL